MKSVAKLTKESQQQRKKRSRTVHGNDDKPTKATKDDEPKQHDLKLDDNATGVI